MTSFPRAVKGTPVSGTVRIIVVLLFFGFCVNERVSAQTQNDLSNIRIEELSDSQLRRFATEAQKLNVSDSQIEQMALQRGMNPVQIVKLKTRLQYFRQLMQAAPQLSLNRKSNGHDSLLTLEQKPVADYNSLFSSLLSMNVGVSVFSNPRLSFEPNLHLPTPPNYQLAADDEVVIDVSGYSEANYRLKVSVEGVLRIPMVGPIAVNGLTLQEAKKRITDKLASTIYSGIRSGKTFVDVTLGSVRSIRVSVIGEATVPGTYTLPSIASAYHALYASGGPSGNGSFRDIQVIRNNKAIAVIDVYDFLLNGIRKNDIGLMDQDVIKVNPYNVRVELKGEVKRPGVYDVLPGENFQKILKYAGGFTDYAYTSHIQVFQNTSRDRRLVTLTEEQLMTTMPKPSETYIISKILNRFTNRVSIDGAVYRPGDYELRAGMLLSALISQADGVREDAFKSRGIIHRLNQDLSPAVVSFDLEKISQKQAPDIPLLPEDKITIFSKFDLKEGYSVSIDGAVSSPGTFLYEEGLTIQDLILLAGGLKESALFNRIEVSRRLKGADSITPKMATIFQYDIAGDLRDSGRLAFALAPFDQVSVRPAPGYYSQQNVVVEGEVRYVGKYTLQDKNERISDIIKRAGGLTPQAYRAGAVLVRTRNFSSTEQGNIRQGMINLALQNLQNGTPAPLVQNQYDEALMRKSDNVGINLPLIMETPGSENDLLLNDGDTLRIPKLLQTVRVSGEVLHPTLVRYDDSYHFKDYINGAGGFNERSLRKRSYIVNANGSARGTKSFLFFRNYPRVSPGSEIYVPIKRERERLRTGEWITVGATAVSVIAILFNAFRR